MLRKTIGWILVAPFPILLLVVLFTKINESTQITVYALAISLPLACVGLVLALMRTNPNKSLPWWRYTNVPVALLVLAVLVEIMLPFFAISNSFAGNGSSILTQLEMVVILYLGPATFFGSIIWLVNQRRH